MKKKYIIPACTAISIRTASLLSGSGNEYGDNQGKIRFSSTEVDASEAD